MRNVRKSLNLLSLFVLVCVNIFSPFSYAWLDDFSVQEENTTEIEETTIEEEPNDETGDDKEDSEDEENSGDEGDEIVDEQGNDNNEWEEDSSDEDENPSKEDEIIDWNDSDEWEGTGLEGDINEDDEISNETENNTEDSQNDENITSGDDGWNKEEKEEPNNDDIQNSQTDEQITDNNPASENEGKNTQNSEKDSLDNELEDMPEIWDDTKTPIDMLSLDFKKPGQLEIQEEDNRNTASYSSWADGYTVNYSGMSYTLASGDIEWTYKWWNNTGWGTTTYNWVANNNRRWWSWDTESNWYDSWNPRSERQWPCPEWWHVPSKWEWTFIMTAWCHLDNECTSSDITTFWYIESSTLASAFKTSFGMVNGLYWSSSPYSEDYNKAWYLNVDGLYIDPSDYYSRNYDGLIRCLKNEYGTPSAQPITVTYNLNGWYWTESWSLEKELREIIYEPDEDWNYNVWTTYRRTPSKEPTWETWWMFDGWYLTWLETRWTWNMESDMTVYAKWLPFEDHLITLGGITLTIMDRNLWASNSWTWCNSSDKSTCGYHFQRWNNYGFKQYENDTNKFPNNEEISQSWTTWWIWHVSTYYSSKYITADPRTDWATKNDNLRWWDSSSNMDED